MKRDIGRWLRQWTEGKIARDALANYVFMFMTMAVSFVAGVIVARTLGPANKGVFDLFLLTTAMAAELCLFGVGNGLIYYLSNRKQPLPAAHGVSVVFALGSGLAALLVGVALLPWLGKALPGLSRFWIVLALTLTPFAIYRSVWANILVGIGRSVDSYRFELLFAGILFLFLIGLLALRRFTVGNLVFVQAGLVVLSAMIAFGYMHYRLAKSIAFDRMLLSNSIKYGLLLYIGYFANTMHFRIDQLMINYRYGVDQVGIYNVGVRLAEFIQVLDAPIILAAINQIGSRADEESRLLTRRTMFIVALAVGAMGCLLALTADWLVLIFGEAFAPAATPLRLLLPGILLWSMSKALSGSLIYNQGRAKVVVAIAAIGAVFNLGLNYLLMFVFDLGIVGAAVASSTSYSICYFMILLAWVRKKRAA